MKFSPTEFLNTLYRVAYHVSGPLHIGLSLVIPPLNLVQCCIIYL